MAKVFQILVPDNTLVSRIISCENQVTELFVIDRADKKFVSEYSSELMKPALYILVNRDKRQLYVGETDDSIKRLRNHEAKDFWTEAIVFHSTTDTLSTTEVKWLEAKTYAELKELGYYDLSENKQVPQQPPLKKNQIYTLEPIFEEAKNYICAAGFDIFFRKKEDPAKAPQVQPSEEHHLFFCTRAGSDAKGYLQEDGKFVVLAGSELRSGECDSLTPKSVEKRQAFIDANCSQSKGKIILKADYTFTSPSAAAGMVVGGSSNGWTRWKDENGKTLEDVFRVVKNSVSTLNTPLFQQLQGRNVKLSLNGKGAYTKNGLVLQVVRIYIEKHPKITFQELKTVFNDDILEPKHRVRGLLFRKEDFDAWQRPDKVRRYGTNRKGALLQTADGAQFYVSTQWTYVSVMKIINIARNEGWDVKVLN